MTAGALGSRSPARLSISLRLLGASHGGAKSRGIPTEVYNYIIENSIEGSKKANKGLQLHALLTCQRTAP